MAKQSLMEKRRQGLENLGRAVIKLVQPLLKPDHVITYEDEFQLGVTLRKAMQASVKAVIDGRQKDKHVVDELDTSVKAANRYLKRKIT